MTSRTPFWTRQRRTGFKPGTWPLYSRRSSMLIVLCLRIFEGWSHGFGLMVALLPEATAALDLCAGFINTGFGKNRARTAPLVKSVPEGASSRATAVPDLSRNSVRTPSRARTSDKGDEPLSFTPRRRVARGDSRPASPSPAAVGNRIASSTASRSTPGLTSDDQATSSSPPSPETPAHSPGTGGILSGYAVTSTQKSNAATAVASDVPPPLPESLIRSNAKTPRKEMTMLDSDAMLDRRRDEAGYGIPVVNSPEERFKRLPDLAIPETDGARNASDEKLKSAYVEQVRSVLSSQSQSLNHVCVQDDLYHRRRQDAVFGLPGTDNDDGR